MGEIKNLPNMTIDELEQFAKNKLVYKMKNDSLSVRSINTKIQELTASDNLTFDEKLKLRDLQERLEKKVSKIQQEVDRMNFYQVIQML